MSFAQVEHPATLSINHQGDELVESPQVHLINREKLYIPKIPPLTNPDLTLRIKRVPSAVGCLISALAFHELTTQVPHTAQIALRPGSWTPKIEYPPIEVFHFSMESLFISVSKIYRRNRGNPSRPRSILCARKMVLSVVAIPASESFPSQRGVLRQLK